MLKDFGVSLYTSFTGQCPRLVAASPLSTVTPLFSLPETQDFQGLSSSIASFYTKVWLLPTLLSLTLYTLKAKLSYRILEVISSHLPAPTPTLYFLWLWHMWAFLRSSSSWPLPLLIFRASHICHAVFQEQGLLLITSPSSFHLPTNSADVWTSTGKLHQSHHERMGWETPQK